MRSNLLATTATLCLMALAACDNHSSTKTAAKLNQPNLADLMKQPAQPVAPSSPASYSGAASSMPAAEPVPSPAAPPPPPAPLPTADPATPDAAYVSLTSGNQLMFEYLALMNGPIDYPQELAHYSRDYASATDGFKKHDLEAALTPKLDAEIARAKTSRYFKLAMNERIGAYDFTAGGFPLPISISDPDYHQSFSDNSEHGLSFSNADAFRLLKPANEADARSIEALRSKGAVMKLIVYLFAQDADPTNRTVKAQIVKVVLVDSRGDPLATQK